MIKSKALVFAGCASLLFATGCVKPTAIADDPATPANRLTLLLPQKAQSGSGGATKFKRTAAEGDGGSARTNAAADDGDGGSSNQTASANGIPGAGAFPGPNGMMMPAPLMVPMMGSPMPGAMLMPPQMPPMMPSPMMSAATLSNPMMGTGSPFVPAAQGIGPNSPLASRAGQPNFNRQMAGMPQAANYSNVPSVNYPTGPALTANAGMPLGSYSQFVRPTGAVYQITDVSNEPDLASNSSSQQTITAGKETREKARATGDVFMRSGPGKSYPTQGVIKRGEVAQVQFCEGKWCKVTVQGKTGYSSARFLNFFKD